MKIHIAQKGDTLWNLSKKYNVDFQTLKGANTQLANPDIIMPGMKIRIPTDKKQVTQSTKPIGPKEKLMTPYKQIPQKAQPVIKEDDQKPKQIVNKKIPIPKLPPISIKMPKLPSIHANQYNIDVDIDDHDTIIQSYQTTHDHHHPPVQEPTKPEPVLPQTEDPVTEEEQWSPSNMMWVPMMPCFYPQQPNYQMPAVNPCQAYQDPAQLYPNYANQQLQWPQQGAQTPAYNSNTKWGELDPNDQPDQEVSQEMTQQPNQSYYQPQWPAQYYQYQTYPYQYPTYGGTGYQNYATYAPREEYYSQPDQNQTDD